MLQSLRCELIKFAGLRIARDLAVPLIFQVILQPISN